MSKYHWKQTGLLFVAAFVFFVRAAGAQSADSIAIKEVLGLDKQWIDAEVGRDQAALERILDEGFLATFASGATVDRAAFIAGIMKSTIEPFEVLNAAIRIHGDVAVVIDSGADGGAKYTWIAMKRQGRWRVISETFTIVKTPGVARSTNTNHEGDQFMKRVTGIGGIFFKAKDPDSLRAWYRRHLGIDVESWGGSVFKWRSDENPDVNGSTVWNIFKADTKYFEPGKSAFMINYRVGNLDEVLRALREEGCDVDPKVDDSEFGKFGWVMDPEGNKVELWQPPEGQ